jgi:NAD(P)-dependent dehydrogenase (short-subunit alcohol dehydrogenase family)
VTGALDGLRALVIGGGSGIGLASARLLARDGALVTISGRTPSKLDAAAAALAEEGLDVRTALANALNGADVAAAVEAAGHRRERLVSGLPARLSTGVTSFSAEDPGGWAHLAEQARLLDEAGFDRLAVSDHVVFREALGE